MVLVKFVAFVIYEILCSLVFMRKSLNANNCWRRQNFENCSTVDLMFIYDERSEFVIIFVWNLIFSAVKNVVSFT